MEIFHIKNLTFTYPLGERCALSNINLSIRKGDFIVLCGQSGCGKTTLIRQLKPILTPFGTQSGEVLYKNQPIKSLDLRSQTQEIGYVLQNPESQIVTDKVWHELAFGLESLGFNTDTIRLKVAEIAHFFGIQTWFHKNVSELSGGQKQLLNLASIMAMAPDVLILDEPTSQLDPIAAMDFLETLKKINKELGTTIILSEHRLEEVFPLADQVIVMENGEVICANTPVSVCQHLIASRHPMEKALPIPARFFQHTTGDCVLTIKEGRQCLEDYYATSPPKERFIERADKTPKGEPLIVAKDVYFKYERNEQDILKNFQFTLHKGEWYGLVGGNGVGKSTTLHLLSGLCKPYRGKIRYKNKAITLLPQAPQSLFIKKTVEEELEEVYSGMTIDSSTKAREIHEIAELVEITSFFKVHPYDLSGGEQQRVALAKVLLTKPQIILLDEPTKGLDAHFKIKLASILKQLQQKGITILMVSHDVAFCAEYTDRCGMFFDGMIVSEDASRPFFSGHYFYTTSSNRMTRGIYDNAVTLGEVQSLWQKNQKASIVVQS